MFLYLQLSSLYNNLAFPICLLMDYFIINCYSKQNNLVYSCWCAIAHLQVLTEIVLVPLQSNFKYMFVHMFLLHLGFSMIFLMIATLAHSTFIHSSVSMIRTLDLVDSQYSVCHKFSCSSQTSSSYFYRLPKLWNCLPSFDLSLTPSTNCRKFKKSFFNLSLQ